MIVKSTVVLGAAFLTVMGTGCATKKYVGKVMQPVENRVTATEATNKEQGAQIGELNNNVSRVDEKATDAEKKAMAAGQSADRANQSAEKANQSAQQAGMRADEASKMAESTRSRVGQVVENLDNYKHVTTETVLFATNRSKLSKDAMEALDQAASTFQNSKNYVLEVQGFADKTGDAQSNLALSERRADSVVRYLTTKHDVPLRKIHVLGLGEETAEGRQDREARKQARKVEVKVFALDLDSAATPPTGARSTASQQQ